MADSLALTVQGRDGAGKGAARATRRAGLVPGVIYGDNKEPILIAIEPRVLIAQMHKPGFSTHIFDIELDGTSHRAMAQDVQMHPVRDVPIHVDFRRIGKNTVVTVEVPVHFTNELASPGLKIGGVLNIVRHEIEVRARPDDLPEQFEIDLSGLEIGDSVHISAVALPDGIKPTITDRDFTICTIAAPTVSVAADDGEEGEDGEAAGDAKDADDKDADDGDGESND